MGAARAAPLVLDSCMSPCDSSNNMGIICSTHIRGDVRTHVPAQPQGIRATVMSSASAPEGLRFLTAHVAHEVVSTHGTPTYVYDEASLKRQARAAL